jgi:hypothetical protein
MFMKIFKFFISTTLVTSLTLLAPLTLKAEIIVQRQQNNCQNTSLVDLQKDISQQLMLTNHGLQIYLEEIPPLKDAVKKSLITTASSSALIGLAIVIGTVLTKGKLAEILASVGANQNLFLALTLASGGTIAAVPVSGALYILFSDTDYRKLRSTQNTPVVTQENKLIVTEVQFKHVVLSALNELAQRHSKLKSNFNNALSEIKDRWYSMGFDDSFYNNAHLMYAKKQVELYNEDKQILLKLEKDLDIFCSNIAAH